MDVDLRGLSSTSLFTGNSHRRGGSSAQRYIEFLCMAKGDPNVIRFVNLIEKLRLSYRHGHHEESTKILKEAAEITHDGSDKLSKVIMSMDVLNMLCQIALMDGTAPAMMIRNALASIANILANGNERIQEPEFIDAVFDKFVFQSDDPSVTGAAVVVLDTIFQRSSDARRAFSASETLFRYIDSFMETEDKDWIEIAGLLIPVFMMPSFPIKGKKKVKLLNCVAKLLTYDHHILALEALLNFLAHDDRLMIVRFFEAHDFMTMLAPLLDQENERTVVMTLNAMKAMLEKNIELEIPLKKVLSLTRCFESGLVCSSAVLLLCCYLRAYGVELVDMLVKRRYLEFFNEHLDSMPFDVKTAVLKLFILSMSCRNEDILRRLDELNILNAILDNIGNPHDDLLGDFVKMIRSLKQQVPDKLVQCKDKLFEIEDELDADCPGKPVLTILLKGLHTSD